MSRSSSSQHNWQSMGTLERTKFVRLRKGYASVRKSFRLAEKSYIQEPVGFMGQLGSRLLRSMRQGTLGGKITINDDDTPIEGSFRVLSAPNSGDTSQISIGSTTTHRKSDVELDIEQRLKRSKRRTLPSARCHRTPAAEAGQAIYEDLNLDELEAIKRDNLRLTLRGGRALESDERRGCITMQPMCSCKSLDPVSGLPDSFCCCKSTSSSSSSPTVGELVDANANIEGSKELPPIQAAICGSAVASDTAHGFKIFEGQQQVALAFNGSQGGVKSPIVGSSQSEARSNRVSHVSDFPNNKLQLTRSKLDVVDKDEEVHSRQQVSSPEVGQKLHRKKHTHNSDSNMRAAKSEWMLSRAAGERDAVLVDEYRLGPGREEHYSWSKEEHREAQVRYWTRRLSGYADYAEQQDELFERQLYAATLNEKSQLGSQKRLNVKRSLLTKIKQLIVPSSTAKETLNHIPTEDRYINTRNNRTLAHSTLNLATGSSSLYYPTAARKSVNLVNYNLSSSKKHLSQMGFLTLGRQQAAECNLRPAARNIFRDDERGPHCYGSMESLPSADSGLSSSNLQNLNEEQHNTKIYSTIEPNRSPGVAGEDDQQNLRFVGRAIAKVDCNPCAYDKEALVFKRGDVIDIIERHHSGTWVGRCHGLVGHFKFINVAEMQKEERGGFRKEQGREGEGTFVTTLEIRNDSNERLNRQQSPQQEGSTQKPEVYYTAHQMNQSSIGAGSNEHQTKVNPIRTQKSQEAASTLEQLLFAIGLANEQVVIKHQQQVSKTGKLECRSYIDIMNSAGLDSLESFSNINDCSRLEQIGINNHEHQQRLLMAARIIRSASEAAKLDFIQNYQTSSVSQHNQSTTRHALPTTNSVKPKGRRLTTLEPASNTEYHEKAQCSNLNEPIYVNLINGRLEEMPVEGTNRVPELKEGWQVQDKNHQSLALQSRNQSASLSTQLYQPLAAKSDQTPVRALVGDGCDSFSDENANYRTVTQNELEDLEQLAFSSSSGTKEQLPSELSVFEQLYSTAKENASLSKACFNPLPSKRSKCSSFTPVPTNTSYAPEHLHPVLSQTISGGNTSNTSSLQQHQQFNNNRSQINPPTSAYDLRLDLSHFFS